MVITPIGSSSSGNAYLVDTGEHRLLLEAGVRYDKIMAAIDFELPDAVILSHEHLDHAKYISAFAVKGIPVVCSNGTANACGVLSWQRGNPDDYGIRILSAIHDCAEPSMFLIDNLKTKERLLFATDTESIPHTIDGISALMVEANWSLHTESEDCEHIERTKNTHLSLEVLVDWLKENDTSRLKEVHLLHLSSDNSHAEYFKQTIAELLGIPVYVH